MLKAKLARASEAGGKAASEASEYRNKVAELERKLLEEERRHAEQSADDEARYGILLEERLAEISKRKETRRRWW